MNRSLAVSTKQITSARHLAINGAEPAFSSALHVGRPNIGSRQRFSELVDGMFDRAWLTNAGPLVDELETSIAARHGVKHCVAMCNGTIALEIAIRALDLQGEVIVPSYTFVATAHALHWQAITPVFADIDPATHNLDPAMVRRMITPRTTGIIGVHLWGRPAPTRELEAIAEEHGLALMFDAAHAFDCDHLGRKIGSFGRCEVLSFHATKVFNTFEGGAVLTDDDALAEKMKLMRNFGFRGYDNVIHPGTNGKMPEVNAAMGLVNLEALPTFVASNKARYDLYRTQLADIDGIRLLEYEASNNSNYQYVVIEVDEEYPQGRDDIVAALHAENILARKYFWPGCHGMQPYRDLYPHAKLMLPSTELVANRVIVLPTGKSMPEEGVECVAMVLRALATR